MWCFLVLLAIGFVAGVVFAIIDGDIGVCGMCTFLGGIAGVALVAVISIGAWIFVPSDGYQLEQTHEYTVAENQEGELLYFRITHDDSSTYLHYLNENNQMKKLYLSGATIHFVEDDELVRIERYTYRYKSDVLQSIAVVPMTKWGDTLNVYISEADWQKYTSGNVENVIIKPAE